MQDALLHLARPLLALARSGNLISDMPIEAGQRREYAHLEAVGRLLCGMSPMLERIARAPSSHAEMTVLEDCRHLISTIADSESSNFVNFRNGRQPLVDAAFLAQAIVRAPTALWSGLSRRAQEDLLNALRKTRDIRPGHNNWLLFSAMIEAAFKTVGESWDQMRVDFALTQLEHWYAGDGCYSDGPMFRYDYYNSYVIIPFLVDILEAVADANLAWQEQKRTVKLRAARHASILERLIGPDGSFPPIGRSITYRCGAFHALAQAALQDNLAPHLQRGQVRCALMAVIERTLSDEDNYTPDGWLRIGLNGSQPNMAESYISTGSLYLCSTAFLPLGLSPSAPFWSDVDRDWTQKALWGGRTDVGADKARD
nr:DUF2264 domain-containing protein [Hyphomicrobium methylovorum]